MESWWQDNMPMTHTTCRVCSCVGISVCCCGVHTTRACCDLSFTPMPYVDVSVAGLVGGLVCSLFTVPYSGLCFLSRCAGLTTDPSQVYNNIPADVYPAYTGSFTGHSAPTAFCLRCSSTAFDQISTPITGGAHCDVLVPTLPEMYQSI
jgi:hypothetical protein